MGIRIDPSERWLILAKTGAGKTEYVKYLLRMVEEQYPIVIIDVKAFWLGKHPKWAEKKELGTVDKPRLVDEFNPKWRVQLLQPDEEDDPRLEKMCNAIMKWGHPIFIYFDETEGIATATHVPGYIRRIWKQGRALEVGAWAATQVPTGIPRMFKSQAEHFIVLKVGEEDAELAASLVHVPEEEVSALKKYEWIHYDTDMDVGEWHPPIPYKEKNKHS